MFDCGLLRFVEKDQEAMLFLRVFSDVLGEKLKILKVELNYLAFLGMYAYNRTYQISQILLFVFGGDSL